MWCQWKKRHIDHKECPEINSYKYNQLTVKRSQAVCFVLTNGVRGIGCLYVW